MPGAYIETEEAAPVTPTFARRSALSQETEQQSRGRALIILCKKPGKRSRVKIPRSHKIPCGAIVKSCVNRLLSKRDPYYHLSTMEQFSEFHNSACLPLGVNKGRYHISV